MKHIFKSSKGQVKDSLLLGVVGGLTGTIAMDIINIFFWQKGTTKTLFGHIAGSIIFNPKDLKKKRYFLIGHLFHMTTGSLLGLCMVEIFKKYGRDHSLIKGSVFGTFVWSILYNLGHRINLFTVKSCKAESSYLSVLYHFIYGTVTSAAVLFFADPNLFPTSTVKSPLSQPSDLRQPAGS